MKLRVAVSPKQIQACPLSYKPNKRCNQPYDRFYHLVPSRETIEISSIAQCELRLL